MTTTEPRAAKSEAKVGAPLGPGSLTWKYHGDRRGLLFLWRTGTLQNMHPAVNSALQQKSNFFDNPWDRLFRSIPPILGVVYDDRPDDTGAQVRDFHREIKGDDDGHGRCWSALSPDTFWWTHVTFVETILAINEFFGTPLTDEEKDQLVKEGVTWWRRYGLSERPVIDNWADFEAYFHHMLDHELEHNATTRWAVTADQQSIPAPPGIPGPVWKVLEWPTSRFNRWLGAGLMPPKAREILGLEWRTRDQVALRVMGEVVRRTWPLLPAKVRLNPRAYDAIKRAEAA
ncbi:oxygenase MpaB family protein [Sporichthya polymorpha]|uniref:oxygenase MpaB family protein n=1 Tax=Sporichthya polymorpha TaxID=35751 RepID=UPI000377D709|nr:oxygenase MpaB family protein [Sporichthya polymorpha]